MRFTAISTALFLFSPLSLMGEPTPATPESAETKEQGEQKEDKPEIKKIGENLFQIGKVLVNSKTKEITIPCTVNAYNDHPIEYILVNQEGKSHEAVFLTAARPLNVNIAFKLTKYLESKELFRKLDKDYNLMPGYEDATPEQRLKSKFTATVKWTVKGEKKSMPLYKTIINAETKKHLENIPWVYGGSYILRGKFKADLNKDLIALLTDRAAIANYAGKGREDGLPWLVNKAELPAEGLKVNLVLTPHREAPKK